MNPGSGISGMENNRCSPEASPPPKTMRNTTRIVITAIPTSR
jgi:hypothetical protein